MSMPQLRLTKYVLVPGTGDVTWDKIADFYIDEHGAPSIRIAPSARKSHPFDVEKCEANFREREGTYSHSLDRNVPFEAGEAFLKALSEIRSMYTKWEWHHGPTSS
jgi:hypothetical protein